MLAVRWYLRYGLSYRDVEELLAERGIAVDHVTIYRWVQRFTPVLIDAARPSRHVAGNRWFVDETYLKVAGQWVYLYRAIDQHGQVTDVLRHRRAFRRHHPPRTSGPHSDHQSATRENRSLRVRAAFNKHRPHRTLSQAAPLRPLPERTRTEINNIRRRDRLGGLLHEYQQVA